MTFYRDTMKVILAVEISSTNVASSAKDHAGPISVRSLWLVFVQCSAQAVATIQAIIRATSAPVIVDITRLLG